MTKAVSTRIFFFIKAVLLSRKHKTFFKNNCVAWLNLPSALIQLGLKRKKKGKYRVEPVMRSKDGIIET